MAEIDKRLEPNCCWLTGKELFEALAVFPQDHPLRGHVLKIGKRTGPAYRVTLLLMDGTNTTVSLHEDALPTVRERLVELWQNMRARYLFLHLHRQSYYGELNEAKYQHGLKNSVKRIDDNPPIDVLGIQSYKELLDERQNPVAI